MVSQADSGTAAQGNGGVDQKKFYTHDVYVESEDDSSVAASFCKEVIPHLDNSQNNVTSDNDTEMVSVKNPMDSRILNYRD